MFISVIVDTVFFASCPVAYDKLLTKFIASLVVKCY